MITIALLLLFLKNYVFPADRGPHFRRAAHSLDGGSDSIDDDGFDDVKDADDDDGKEEKKTLKAKLQVYTLSTSRYTKE